MPKTIEKKEIVILAALLAAAAALRVATIGRESLWFDECVSWLCSSKGFWASLACDANKPPLYYPMLHAWRALFGSGEAAMRALSVPPGVVTVWLIYALAKKLFSREVAWIAAGCQAISTLHIYFAQEARNYTWLVMFLLLAGLFLWQAVEAGSRLVRLKWYAAYMLCATLALYTHYFAAFFLAAHGAYVLVRRPRQVLWAGIGIGTACALVFPWLLIMIRTPGMTEEHPRQLLLLRLPQAYFSFMFGDRLIPVNAQAVQHIGATLWKYGWVLALALATCAILLPFCMAAWKRWGEGMTFTVINATVPVLIAFIVSFKKMLFEERYMLPSSPYLYIALAAAVWEIGARGRSGLSAPWKVMAGKAAVACYCCLLAVALYDYYFVPGFEREPWREATGYLEQLSGPDRNDLLIFDPGWTQICYRCYQKRDLPVASPRAAQEALQSDVKLRALTKGYRMVRLVHWSHFSDDSLLMLRRLFTERSHRAFLRGNDIEIFSFEVTKP